MLLRPKLCVVPAANRSRRDNGTVRATEVGCTESIGISANEQTVVLLRR